MSQPPKKRLKQSSIFDSFKKIGSKSNMDKNRKPSTDQEQTKQPEYRPFKPAQHYSVKTVAPVHQSLSKIQDDHTQSDNTDAATNSTVTQHGGDGAMLSHTLVSQDGDSNSSDTLEYSNSMEDSQASVDISNYSMESESAAKYEDAHVGNSPRRDVPKWRGTPLEEMNRTPDCISPSFPKHPEPSKHHTVLVKVERDSNFLIPPPPSFDKYKDLWDGTHVRLPCSNENLYPVKEAQGKGIQHRWSIVEHALLNQNISNSYYLEESILKYNTRFESKWDFEGLHSYFRTLNPEERDYFFQKTLPEMAKLALRLPELCTQPIPLLTKGYEHSITMSQQQIACLLANAFFCTFPRRNSKKAGGEYSAYPDINFNNFFQKGYTEGRSNRKNAKFHCIFNYFKRVTENMPTGTVTFTRQRLHKDKVRWDKAEEFLTKLCVSAEGTIEDTGYGMRQVDFANRFIGGGVLGFGCVQEEIRFMICPEMIISRLFTEELSSDECLIMTGCERFSDYSGYSDSFEFICDHKDETPRDSWGRRCTEVVAIDALVFRSNLQQFQFQSLKREIDKAYCGFLYRPVGKTELHSDRHFLPAIATGKWGCGAFGGNPRLKALIQLMAAAKAHRDVCFFTFGDTELQEDLYEVHQCLVKNNARIKDVWKLIGEYRDNLLRYADHHSGVQSIFEYILDSYSHTKSSLSPTSSYSSAWSTPDHQATPESPTPSHSTAQESGYDNKKQISDSENSVDASPTPTLNKESSV